MEKTFNEYMEEIITITRWKLLVVGLTGAFAGACLMFMFSLLGLSS